MKKNILTVSIVLALALTGCSAAADEAKPAKQSAPEATPTPTPTAETPAAEPEPAPPAEPADLTGKWKQTNTDDPARYQLARIKGKKITIHWVNESEDSKSIYWVGTFKAPKTATEPYTWKSKRNKAATDYALLASTDNSKKFTYENGVISYSMSIMGTTSTIKLERQ